VRAVLPGDRPPAPDRAVVAARSSAAADDLEREVAGNAHDLAVIAATFGLILSGVLVGLAAADAIELDLTALLLSLPLLLFFSAGLFLLQAARARGRLTVSLRSKAGPDAVEIAAKIKDDVRRERVLAILALKRGGLAVDPEQLERALAAAQRDQPTG
jgi:hypothetical protein